MEKKSVGALALGFALIWGSARAAPYGPFYPYTYHVATKAAFIARFRSELRVDRAALIRLFNQTTGAEIGVRVKNFDDLLDFIASDEVVLAPCSWGGETRAVTIYGVRGRDRFNEEHRGCRARELVLSYRGRAIFSTYCGNLVLDERAGPLVPVAALTPGRRWCEATEPFTVSNYTTDEDGTVSFLSSRESRGETACFSPCN